MRFKDTFDIDKLFFTSDTHFFHKNIIQYCTRPYMNRDDMNAALVRSWNLVVPKDGIVFHLGDVALTSNPKELSELLYDLNGTIHLIIGNHEKDVLKHNHIKTRFASIHDITEITIEDPEIDAPQQIIMCHYPMLAWNGSHRGSWQLFGHVHGGLSNKGILNHKPTQLDVGVDSHFFTPISYQTVKTIITKQCLK